MSQPWQPQQQQNRWWSRTSSRDAAQPDSLRQTHAHSYTTHSTDEKAANKLRAPSYRRVPSASKLANAFGLGKSKKQQPELAIQDPPDSSRPPASPFIQTALRHQQEERPVRLGRPPARSVSTVATEAEPRTPSDAGRNRGSVLTLSDPDPFAAHVVSPTAPQDRSRLSAYSDKSQWDQKARKPIPDRLSYASGSSSLSYHTGESSGSGKTRSRNIEARQPCAEPSKLASASRVMDISQSTSRQAASSTLTDANRRSNPPPATATRPPLRPRGKTESGSSTSREGTFLPKDQTRPAPSPASSHPSSRSDSPDAPVVIVRQPSSTRLRVHAPPSAPPKIGLPPPPLQEARTEPSAEDEPSDWSSTRLSFASSISSHRDIIQALESAGAGFELSRSPPLLPVDKPPYPYPSAEPQVGNTAPQTAMPSRMWSTPALTLPLRIDSSRRTLKKAVSQQSLGSQAAAAHAYASSCSTPPATVVGDDGHAHPVGRAPRKQRSFHTPRLPLPSVPLPTQLRHASSFGLSSTNDASPRKDAKEPGEKDSRRASTSSTHQPRKRLFSGPTLRRSSTQASQTTQQDDVRSLFSLQTDEQHSSRGLPGSPSAPASPVLPPGDGPAQSPWWDDSSTSAEKALADSSDWEQPQQILSPAEITQLEAEFDEQDGEHSYTRSRGASFTSVSTANMSLSNHGHADRPTSSGGSSYIANMRSRDRPYSGRLGADSFQPLTITPTLPSRSHSMMYKSTPNPSLATRPSTAQSPPASPLQSSTQPPPRPLTGLSPPPRRRPTVSKVTVEEQTVGQLLLPGELPTNTANKRASIVPVNPLSPPPIRRSNPSMRKPTIAQTLLSKAQKPSFLEIGDGNIAERGRSGPARSDRRPVADNFLDLDRSSFDTVRSDTLE
ncbi:hypothetical protein PUNSTDRAFT_48860 [Punctularia strigosozonata HHB-11173 SS5]|uniref:uncharacterized protein n=1 Tax=Punctularia strigosozonata (strain HHB-11173) TaxID=741275 RepID=UPI0004416DB8|nr:uncharacterized protein PUNSTDRAFT_48860 [Punctularia strigosozonata HHB-11173 SS5]EIN13994.1 hypothetical protein PUNSTDRAFT_48860 [Punctularia strigosozonata HHB-11173 SS5]